MVEAREAQSKAIVENVEQEWATVNEREDRREAALREPMERERSRAEAAEARVEDSELDAYCVANSPFLRLDLLYHRLLREAPTDILTQGKMDLSPTVAMASRAQRSGKSRNDSPRCMRTTYVCRTSMRRRTPSAIAWLGRLRRY